jgi:hypothetical protein
MNPLLDALYEAALDDDTETARDLYLETVPVAYCARTILPSETLDPLFKECVVVWLDAALRRDTVEGWSQLLHRLNALDSMAGINGARSLTIAASNACRKAGHFATRRLAALQCAAPAASPVDER